MKNSSLVSLPPPLLFLFEENIFSILFTIKLDEKVSKIEIKPLWHRGKNQVGIYLKYDELLACKLQAINQNQSPLEMNLNKLWVLTNRENRKTKMLKGSLIPVNFLGLV